MKRISYLDGHRGIAILLVIGFHSYSRWVELLPYNDAINSFPLFKYGFLGVQLFFLISGFVILMTLERCQNTLQFMIQRWLRLFPAMLICSFFIYFTAFLFIERPAGQPKAIDLIPGLTFIEPYLLNKITGMSTNSIESAFWSLYVEFKFYIIAALIYFRFGAKKLASILFACTLLWFTFATLHTYFENPLIKFGHSITTIMSFQYFGWFAAGACFYLYTKLNNNKWFIYGIFIIITSILIMHNAVIATQIAALVVSLFFILSIKSKIIQKILNNPVFLLFGLISYPLYLIHENIMVSTIIKLNSYSLPFSNLLFPFIALFAVSAIAWLITKHIEKPIKNIFSQAIFAYPLSIITVSSK